MHIQRMKILMKEIILLSAVIGFVYGQSATQGIMEAKKLIQQGSAFASKEKFELAQSILARYESQNEHLDLVEYYLGYIDYQMAVVVCKMDPEKAPAVLDSAVVHLEKAISINENMAEAHALLSSCYGVQISFSPMSGAWRGPKSGYEMQKAQTLSPENPRVALLGAIGIYNTPTMYGGGKEEGFEAMKEAVDLFQRWKNVDSLQPDWGVEQVHAWLGLAHLNRKETILARKEFDKALEINPDYGWVKYVLLPKVISEPEVH